MNKQQAVREYQKLTALIERRIKEGSGLDNARFWLDIYYNRGLEIASKYSLTLLELVEAWEAWCEEIDAQRARAYAEKN